ncbi:S-adenosyl-L-methionine-dependent methyltransferase [Agrocybe pediades]|nr:S-adenosyl-L-methionine-dependent methyltransferase [Agrocybe pediades]
MPHIRALEFYSGIGGLHLALSRSKVDAAVIQAFDWDQAACNVYRVNHGDVIRKADISCLTAEFLSSFQADLWLLSPACQPYTVLNPNAKGAEDPRAQSFLHLVKNVLPELAARNEHPSRLLVENVAGFEDSTTRQLLISTLRSIGYTTVELLLTPLQFGIPNSRLRYYLLAKKAPIQFTGITSEKGPLLNVQEIRSFMDSTQDSHDFSIPEKVLIKWGRLFDIVKPSSRRTCCFTRGYTQLVERAGSVLQENEDADVNSHAIKILEPLRLRYFSPSELLRIFAFDLPASESVFTWPDSVTRKTKYKLIGNSVNVKVVQSLIEYLFDDSPN